MNKQELEEKLQSLLAEHEDINAKLDQVDEWDRRMRQLVGNYGSSGEIESARRAIRDSDFPIYEQETKFRIIAVDDKWITLRQDFREESDVKRYRVKDGMEGQKKKYGSTIDVQKALEIWKNHKENHE